MIENPEMWLVGTFLIGSFFASFGFGFQAVIYVLVSTQITTLDYGIALNVFFVASCLFSAGWRGAISGAAGGR